MPRLWYNWNQACARVNVPPCGSFLVIKVKFLHTVYTFLMMVTQSWSAVLLSSLQNLWIGVVAFLPKLILAVVIFLIGWLIASLIEKALRQIIDAVKIDALLRKTGIHDTLAKGGIRFSTSAFIAGLVKWFFVIVFLVAALDVIGLSQVNLFLREVVLGYLPNVVVAALVLLVGSVLAETVGRLVSGSARMAEVRSAGFLGTVAKWAIWIFTILIALSQLGIAAQLIQTLFIGVVAMFALAGGLAFGLGGKDAASRIVEKMREAMSSRG